MDNERWRSIEKHVVGNFVWNKVLEMEQRSYERFVKVLRDRTGTNLKSELVVAYIVHVVLLNIFYGFGRGLIEGGYLFLGVFQFVDTIM